LTRIYDVHVVVSVAFYGVSFALTLYFQEGRGLSPLQTGLTQFPTSIGLLAGSQLAGRVTYWRIGPRRHISASLAGMAVFMALLALLGAQTSLWWPGRCISVSQNCTRSGRCSRMQICPSCGWQS